MDKQNQEIDIQLLLNSLKKAVTAKELSDIIENFY